MESNRGGFFPDHGDWSRWYTEQLATERPANVHAEQSNFEEQLSGLRVSSADAAPAEANSPDAPPAERHRSIRRTGVGGSMRMPPGSNLQDNWVGDPRLSVDVPRAHRGSAARPSQSDLRGGLFDSARYTAPSEAPLRRGRRITKAVDCFRVLSQSSAKLSGRGVAESRPLARRPI